MNQFKKYFSLLLALTLMLTAFSGCGKEAAPAATEAAPAETVAETAAAVVAETEAPAQEAVSDGYYHVGDKIDDFTVTTYDGKEVSLYKLLEEKEMVLLNLWATFCGPCAAEFPAMQEAYEQYQDKVGIIALSTDPTDSDEILAEYVQKKGMTFHVTRDTVNLEKRVHSSGIPTSIVVDRFGIICAIASGGEPETSVFTNLFEIFTAEDYTESIFMPKLSAKLAEAEPADPAQLNEALNGEGGNLVFTNHISRFYWPMVVEEKDGRTVASASNADFTETTAAVETQVEAKAGDVLVMDYKLGGSDNFSIMRMTVDKKDVKVNSLSRGWTTTYYQFKESGIHYITVSFEKSMFENDGTEGLWIDSIRLATGDEAAQIMAENPQYPVSEELKMAMLNENAQVAAILKEDTNEVDIPIRICADPVLRFEVMLPESADPESAFLTDFGENQYPLSSYIDGDRYSVEVPNADPVVSTSCQMGLYYNGSLMGICFVCVDMEQAAEFAYPAKVVLWDDSLVMAEEPEGDGTYTVTYVDQNGDPVPGVMCQVCDANTCQVFVSNADGICEFTLPAGAYEIHTLMVPAGYEGDTETVTEAPTNGGELSFTLTKK